MSKNEIEDEGPLNPQLLSLFHQMPCCECGKKPCHACYILPLEHGGTKEYFNYFPLCIKHCSEQMRVGTIAIANKYINVKRYLIHKGWEFGRKLRHKDSRGET